MPDHYPDTINEGKLTSKDFSTKTGKLANISKRVVLRLGKVEKRSAINSEKITRLKNIEKAKKDPIGDKLPGSSGGIGNILQDIADNMGSIKNTILEQQKVDVKAAEADRKEAEKTSRAKQEKGLEGKFKGLTKIATKVLSPVKSLWERIVDFVKTIFLGRVAMKLFDWFSDKKNQKKVKAIGRFFKDFWPALLTGYLEYKNTL